MLFRVSTCDVTWFEGAWAVVGQFLPIYLISVERPNPADVLTALYAADLIADEAILSQFEYEQCGDSLYIDYIANGEPAPFFELTPVDL